MKLILPLLLAGLLCAGSAFSQGVQIEKAPPAEQKPTPVPVQAATEALFDYVQKYKLVVAKYHVGTRYIWTDRAMIEITEAPPPEPMASLLAAAPHNTSQFSTWVNETFERQVKTWKPGKKNPNPSKPGTDELVADVGGTRCFVNPVYLSYVLARYPDAIILLKDPKDPALFTVKGQLKAVVSPWTHLPDGTPLL